MEEAYRNKKAVAVRYDRAQDRAPKVVAQGQGRMAEKILETAGEAGLPIYEDPTLVELLSQLDLGEEIPDDLYQMVAEVLLFIYTLDRRYAGK